MQTATSHREGVGTPLLEPLAKPVARPVAKALKSASLAAKLPFIFQLPAISFVIAKLAAYQVKTILPTC
jgi:hypothetical protein